MGGNGGAGAAGTELADTSLAQSQAAGGGSSIAARTSSTMSRGIGKKVTQEQAEHVAKFEGFTKYIETSSLFGEGVKNVFDEALHVIIKD